MKPRFSSLLLTAAFALVVLLGVCVVSPRTAYAAPGWITSGVTASASDAVSPFLPSRAVDGSVAQYSHWYSSGNAEFYLDLGKPYLISKIKLVRLSESYTVALQSNSTPSSYTVYAGNALMSKTTLLSFSSTDTLSAPVVTRFLTITFGNGHQVLYQGQAWTGLTEVTAYGAPIQTVDLPAIGLTPPAAGAAPQSAITPNSEYTGAVTWSPAVGTAFDHSQVYTATINLTCLPGYQLDGVSANFFTVAGAASVTNAANSGVVTAVFPATAPPPYTVSYNANGGSGSMPDGTATKDVAFRLPDCGFTAPDGKEFMIWAIGSADGTKVSAGSNYTFVQDTQVYAVWRVPVTGITGVPAGATVGTPLTLTGTVAPANATNQSIVWSVKNPGGTGASIAGSTLSATSAGSVTVTATIAGGGPAGADYTQDFTIAVSLPFVQVTGITGVPAAATAGTPLTLTGTVAPANATNQTIVWSVKDPGSTGASIVGNALSATSAGSVTVTATIVGGGPAGADYTQDFAIAVSLPFVPVTGITGVPEAATVGTPLTLTGTVAPANATNQTIVWSMKNPGVTGASIVGNALSATSAGSVTVTATIAGGGPAGADYTQDFAIAVSLPFVPVTGITGVPTAATVGTPLTLTGTVAPANATNQTIVWSVKNPGGTGASIVGNALSATSAGSVTVTATIVGGGPAGADYTQDFAIAVSLPFVPVTGITGVLTAATVGTPLTLTGTVAPANATNQTIVWSMKNPGVTGASIVGNALSATSAGSVTVTATIAGGGPAGADYTQDFAIAVSLPFVPVTGITGVPTAATVGTPLTLTGTVAPANATNQTIVWSVKNPGGTGASIVGSTLSATSAGSVTVTATIAGGGPAGANYTQDFTITWASASTAPTIVTQPLSQTVTAGSTATFTAAADGNPAPSYQWQVSADSGAHWSNVADGVGGTQASYTTPTTTVAMNGYQYRCTAANSAGSVNSSAAVLTVNSAPVMTYLLTVHGGTGSGHYAQGTSILVTADAPAAGMRFKAWIVTSGGGTLTDPTSVSATYVMPGNASDLTATYEAAIRITTQPADAYVVAGQRASFGVSAGSDGLTYQWQVNRNDGRGWRNLDSKTGASYTTTPVTLKNDGYQYVCLITDTHGYTLKSAIARLHVSPAAVPPETGDRSTPALWLGACLLGALGLALTARKRRRS